MSKRLVFRLAVMVTALGAVTLLQGCDWDEHGVTIGAAWMPVGWSGLPALVVGTGTGGGVLGGGGQVGGGGAIGGAIAGAAGGGGQVSTGVAY